MAKSIKEWSLIASWLTVSPWDWEVFQRYLSVLEEALLRLDNLPEAHRDKIHRKLRMHSDRADTKAALAEASLALFFVENRLPFSMEVRLCEGSDKDVDFSVEIEGESIFVEVQSLQESEPSQHSSMVSAAYGLPVSIDFKREEDRIIRKIHKKLSKLVEHRITLIALDCTAVPEHGGVGMGTIPDALAHVFTQDEPSLTKAQQEIRRLVDGVLWFQLNLSNALKPIKRGCILNRSSRHHESLALRRFASL